VAVGLAAQAGLLGALAATVGLSPLGWGVGLLCGVVPCVAVARTHPVGRTRAAPADLVTLTRALIACAVAALVADSFVASPPVAVLVVLSVVALVLDAVDGFVARRTRTSVFGARFDGEADAFLILALSVYAVHSFSSWVLAIGLARYAFALAGWPLPWLRAPLPPRYWRKAVAAVQGVVLTAVAAEVRPSWLLEAALVVAAALLAESFGRDVWWLWRRRKGAATDAVEVGSVGDAGPVEPAKRQPRVVAAGLDVLALLVVWCALVAPDQLPDVTASAFLRVPVEALVVCGLALVLPTWARRAMAGVVGTLFGLVMVLKLLDMGYFAALDRPFNLLTDLGFLAPLEALVRSSLGRVTGDIVLLAALLVVVGLVVFVPLSLGRLTRVVARHRRRAGPVIAALTVLSLFGAATGTQVPAGQPFTSASSVRIAADHVRAIAATVRGERQFTAGLTAPDPQRDVARDQLLAGLRGKNVLITFVESYGRGVVDGPRASDEVRSVLESGTTTLGTAGYASRSAFLTSPTFGGYSWLAHATLESGLWVSDPGRFDKLMASNRMTLSRYFRQAGWRTVAAVPSNHGPWPDGKAFYRFDAIYDGLQLGYDGPTFGFSSMPDQFALEALQRSELARLGHPPVMAQVELASSHAPWTTVPRMVDWNRLGDGSVFEPMRRDVGGAVAPSRLPAAYADSIAYSLSALISFVETYGNDDLVLILLGDHQPATVVSGYHASRDVPITIITKDRSVLGRIAQWHWQPGLLPNRQAPVWPMDAFRDRLLDAYSGPPPSVP
jgi:phosphatidylglycerophosphate synthase